MLNVAALCDVTLTVVMLSVTILSDVMLNAAALGEC